MASCNFFRFPKLKLPLRERRFESVALIEENSLRELKAIPESAFAGTFKDWEKRWLMCITVGGDYFEADKINIDK